MAGAGDSALVLNAEVASAVDTSANPRVAGMLELVEKLSCADEPREILQIYAEGFRRIRPFHAYLSLSTRELGPGRYKITRFIADFDKVPQETFDPWSQWQKLPSYAGGILGHIIAHGRPLILNRLRASGDEAVGDLLAPFRSLMAIPLFDRGRPLNWAIQLDERDEAFDVDELDDSILRSNLVGGTVLNLLISKQLRAANRWIENEVDQIASIQRALLPRGRPQIPGLEIATHYETFDRAAGDLYDFVAMPAPDDGGDESDQWGILVADASGHGPSAAVVIAMMHSIVHAFPGSPRSPSQLLEYANSHLSGKRISDSFVTAFFAMYEPKTRLLRYSRAGHPPPLLKKSSGSGSGALRVQDAGGFPLGIVPDAKYEDGSVLLEPGQTFVLYTDGITEADGPNQDQFGIDGIEASVSDCSGEPGRIVESIMSSQRVH